MKRPIVLDAGELRQAKAAEDLELSVADRCEALERQVRMMAMVMAIHDLTLTPELIELSEEAEC